MLEFYLEVTRKNIPQRFFREFVLHLRSVYQDSNEKQTKKIKHFENKKNSKTFLKRNKIINFI